jgi:antitoxin component of MazEF toxin-antitoxin module
MDTVTGYWGNSLGFRIPKKIQEISNITNNTQIHIEAEPDRLIITKVKTRQHIPFAERLKSFKDWEGKPYELTDEDTAWANLPTVGEEVQC